MYPKFPKYVINYYQSEKFPWYVQQIGYLDMGRFTTEAAAEEQLAFLLNRDKEYD